MRTTHSIIFLALCLVLIGGAARAQSSLNDLSWLAGCWEGKDANREFSEQWMKPAGNLMLGAGRTIIEGKKIQYEFIRIRREENGDILYIPIPSGQQETSFKLVSANAGKFTFANPEHDFPQRIIYGLENKVWLVARIEGTIKGKAEHEDFKMKRVRCEAGK